MNDYLKTEIATEVAWQVGDIMSQRSRADSRHIVCNITKRIIDAGFIKDDSEDIDELIHQWLSVKEGYVNGGFR
jgi:DNA-directed RNA polymerase specialized sigma54-like protein